MKRKADVPHTFAPRRATSRCRNRRTCLHSPVLAETNLKTCEPQVNQIDAARLSQPALSVSGYLVVAYSTINRASGDSESNSEEIEQVPRKQKIHTTRKFKSSRHFCPRDEREERGRTQNRLVRAEEHSEMVLRTDTPYSRAAIKIFSLFGCSTFEPSK
ncbi:hypothetical protein BDZ89DRAFT_835060 [Hymenopellis radicata]|nr:hypothetical protein BDZ89DRAFT_835060 [Hymenopellis radicata]